ncbi:MAG: CbiQ family ECF transporter T component [Methylophilaceae bacterium]
MNTKTQLIAFFLFALIVNVLHLNVLLFWMLALLALLVYLNNSHFLRLMRRLKWFYLVMLLIFIFNTPGEHVAHWPFSVKPTYEGLRMGVEQVLRIAVILAALSIVLTQNTKQQLISGLYFSMRPLSYLGLDVKRFAARLWLTLHYVELQQGDKENRPHLTSNLGDYLSDILVSEARDNVAITLDNPKQTWVDYVVIGALTLILVFELVL